MHVKQRKRDKKRKRTKIEIKQSRADKKRGTTYQSGMAMHLIANEDAQLLSKKRKLHDFLKSSIPDTKHKNNDSETQNSNKKGLIVQIGEKVHGNIFKSNIFII